MGTWVPSHTLLMQNVYLLQCVRRRNCTNAKRRTMCASDGKEYPSRCHVKLEACLTRHNIEVVHSGKCMSNKPDDSVTFQAIVSTCIPHR